MKMIKIILILCLLQTTIMPIFAAKQVSLYKETSLRPQLMWVPVKDATGYEIKIKELNLDGTVSSTLTTTSTTLTSFQVSTTLTAGQFYKATVKTTGVSSDKLTIYLKPKATFVIVPTHDLQPDNDDVNFNFDTLDLTALDNVANQTWRATLQLPDGCTVSKFEIFYKDAGAATTLVRLLAATPGSDSTSTFLSLSEIFTSGSGVHESASDITITNALVDNTNYQYYVIVGSSTSTDQLQAGTIMQQFRVYYEGEPILL